MDSLTAHNLLYIWEQGHSASPVRRALLLLAIAHPDQPWDALTQLSIGRRDGLLLSLREQLFGPHIASVTHCPQCQEPLELNFTVNDVRVQGALRPAAGDDPAAELALTVEGYTVQFRLPDSGDLESVAGCCDGNEMQQRLLEGCIVAAQHQGEARTVAELPAAVVEAIASHMAAADPQADVQIDLSCPACHHEWQSRFDIVHFLWGELHAWAQRTLVDVHRLALAYGWGEADILAMSPQRRQFYLEMVQR
ncbi:phage baseplate protein [filamentous cyanobacterium CCP3]|nr:phage baseplate protein [filamentous cyanobacterium CCP3]